MVSEEELEAMDTRIDRARKVIVVLNEQSTQKCDKNWSYLHQCLLMLLDSPLNHSGHLEIYIRFNDSRMAKIHREARIPRTFRRFDQLFKNFLDGCDMPIVQTRDGHARLLQFTGKSMEKHLSNNCKRIRIDNLAPRVVRADDFGEIFMKADRPIAFYVDFGPVNFNILGEGKDSEYEIKTYDNYPDEDTYSLSRYPLSPSLTCIKLATSFEKALGID